MHWQSICLDSQSQFKSISNSLQQVSCCHKAKLEKSQLQLMFPDIKAALVVKLTLNCEGAFKQMEETLKIFQKCLSEVQCLSEKLLKTLNSVSLHEDSYTWTAAEPSIADIALWIEGVGAIMNESLAKKRDILEQLSYIFLKLDENVDCKHAADLESLWNANQKFIEITNELFAYCFHLLPSK